MSLLLPNPKPPTLTLPPAIIIAEGNSSPSNVINASPYAQVKVDKTSPHYPPFLTAIDQVRVAAATTHGRGVDQHYHRTIGFIRETGCPPVPGPSRKRSRVLAQSQESVRRPPWRKDPTRR